MKTIIFCLLGICACVWGIYEIEKRHCYSAYANFAPEFVGAITGCMITVDEQRVPAESLRMTL